MPSMSTTTKTTDGTAKLFEFTLTDEAARKIVEALSDSGRLSLSLKRSSKDTFQVGAKFNGEAIFKMESIALAIGDEFDIDGVYIELDEAAITDAA